MLSLNRSLERPWVVLVEDDESLSGQLGNALSRALPELAIQCTPDADVALELVRDSRSRLLITEVQTACVDGLALAACARRGRPELPLIFLVDARLTSGSVRVPNLPGSHLVDKPPRLDHFVDLVAHVLEPAAGFHGELSTSGVFELVQLAAMVAPNGALRLAGRGGSGAVWFEGGSVVHAVFGGARGSAAFQRMLALPAGQFSIDAAACAPERSVSVSTMALLLDAARVLDEARDFDEAAEARAFDEAAEARDREALAALHGVEQRTSAHQSGASRETRDSHVALRAVRAPHELGEWEVARAGSAAVHFERGLSAVERKDYAAALPHWEAAAEIDPENRLYQHNLMRLRRLVEVNGEPRFGR